LQIFAKNVIKSQQSSCTFFITPGIPTDEGITLTAIIRSSCFAAHRDIGLNDSGNTMNDQTSRPNDEQV